ncbi:MAG: C10 family peptidase [Gemmatimonadota bacterium]
MKTTVLLVALALLALPVGAATASTIVTEDEARTVAENWVALIAELKGGWAGTDTPEVAGVEPLKRVDRTVGHYCRIKPRGFVVVSLLKGLAPVKVYSTWSELRPESEEGPADLVKGRMAAALDWIEAELGPLDLVELEVLQNLVPLDYSSAWAEFLGDSGSISRNYAMGETLLTSTWHQDDPYNRHCPPGDGCDHTLVGCVATAGSQIMRYWDWPPYGIDPYNDPYDWANMRDVVTAGSPQVEIDAVAELCYEVGVCVGMTYGCNESSAPTAYMVGVYVDYYRYSPTCVWVLRDEIDPIDWFESIKAQINWNQPMQYRIPGHSVVVDGWQEIGPGPTRQYHVNYGWPDTGMNAWYTLDQIPGGDPPEEYMVANILPDGSVYSTFSGVVSVPEFPCRYFNIDAVGTDATFQPGHYLQFLPDITVGCAAGYVRFVGLPGAHTRLYTNGDASTGIRVHDGAVKVSPGGEIAFRWRG